MGYLGESIHVSARSLKVFIIKLNLTSSGLRRLPNLAFLIFFKRTPDAEELETKFWGYRGNTHSKMKTLLHRADFSRPSSSSPPFHRYLTYLH